MSPILKNGIRVTTNFHLFLPIHLTAHFDRALSHVYSYMNDAPFRGNIDNAIVAVVISVVHQIESHAAKFVKMDITKSTHFFWTRVETDFGVSVPVHIKNIFQ